MFFLYSFAHIVVAKFRFVVSITRWCLPIYNVGTCMCTLILDSFIFV